MERDSVVVEFEGDSSIANQGKAAGLMYQADLTAEGFYQAAEGMEIGRAHV